MKRKVAGLKARMMMLTAETSCWSETSQDLMAGLFNDIKELETILSGLPQNTEIEIEEGQEGEAAQ